MEETLCIKCSAKKPPCRITTEKAPILSPVKDNKIAVIKTPKGLFFLGGVTFFDERDEEVSVRVRVNFAAMRRWALQYALHTKIMSPKSLAEQVRNDIKEAMENYEV